MSLAELAIREMSEGTMVYVPGRGGIPLILSLTGGR
jgi:hypothetical protein